MDVVAAGYKAMPCLIARCYDPEDGLDFLRYLLHVTDIHCVDDCVFCASMLGTSDEESGSDSDTALAPQRWNSQQCVTAKANSLGFLVEDAVLAELLKAADLRDENGMLLRAPPVVNGRVSLGPAADTKYDTLLRIMSTSSIPVERSINRLTHSVFTRGVGNQGEHRTLAKMGAGRN